MFVVHKEMVRYFPKNVNKRNKSSPSKNIIQN